MSYTEVNVNVNGAAESTQYFEENTETSKFANAILATQRFAYDNSDFDVEIYVLHHPHEQGIDCECIQYEQSHKPYWERKGDKK